MITSLRYLYGGSRVSGRVLIQGVGTLTTFETAASLALRGGLHKEDISSAQALRHQVSFSTNMRQWWMLPGVPCAWGLPACTQEGASFAKCLVIPQPDLQKVLWEQPWH